MNVQNTLIWTIIYTSLIYPKNVVTCFHAPGPPKHDRSGASSSQNPPNLRKADSSSDSIASVHSTTDSTVSIDSDVKDNTNTNNDKNNNNSNEVNDNCVIIESDDVDNGCGCTCKNFWCGLFTCGLYNCVKCCKSKSKPALAFVHPYQRGTVTGIELNIKSKKSTPQFDYKKSRKYITFTAKQGYGFSSIITQERDCCCSGCCGSGCFGSGCCGSSCCGSCCSTTDVSIWRTTDKSEFALEVKVYRKCCQLQHVEIHKANGKEQTLCCKHDINPPLEHLQQ